MKLHKAMHFPVSQTEPFSIEIWPVLLYASHLLSQYSTSIILFKIKFIILTLHVLHHNIILPSYLQIMINDNSFHNCIYFVLWIINKVVNSTSIHSIFCHFKICFHISYDDELRSFKSEITISFSSFFL